MAGEAKVKYRVYLLLENSGASGRCHTLGGYILAAEGQNAAKNRARLVLAFLNINKTPGRPSNVTCHCILELHPSSEPHTYPKSQNRNSNTRKFTAALRDRLAQLLISDLDCKRS